METANAPGSKKKGIIIAVACAVVAVFIILCLTHVICLKHDWQPATCTEPSYCTKCKRTQGEPNGHTPETDPVVLATCTATGLTEGSHCSVCGEILVKQEVVPEHGHTLQDDPAVAPTCTETGLTAGDHCSVCGTVLIAQEVVPALGHTPVVDEAVAPTCTETGLTEGTHCSVCGTVLIAQEVVPALGHTPVIDEAVAATCTETGLTEGNHCSVCGEVLVAQKETPAKGHKGITDLAVAPACTETGLTEGKHCAMCGEILVAQQTVPALGHIAVTDAAVAPTCTETGLTEGSHCSVCCTVLIAQEVVPALGHTPVVDEAVAPTCTETGLTEGSHCSVCGAVLAAQETVPALGHTVIIDAAVAPTCTGTGLTEGSRCSVCGAVLAAQETVPALGHTPVVDEAVAPTCTGTGLTEGSHCSVCGAVLKAQETVPALGHTVIIDAAVAPTCTGTGLTEGSHCSVCSAVLKAQETVPAAGHTPAVDPAVPATFTETGLTEGSHCSVCGEILIPQEVVPVKINYKKTSMTEFVSDAGEDTVRLSFYLQPGATMTLPVPARGEDFTFTNEDDDWLDVVLDFPKALFIPNAPVDSVAYKVSPVITVTGPDGSSDTRFFGTFTMTFPEVDLTVTEPAVAPGEAIMCANGNLLYVSGRTTDGSVSVTANGQVLPVAPDGTFSGSVTYYADEPGEVEIVASAPNMATARQTVSVLPFRLSPMELTVDGAPIEHEVNPFNRKIILTGRVSPGSSVTATVDSDALICYPAKVSADGTYSLSIVLTPHTYGLFRVTLHASQTDYEEAEVSTWFFRTYANKQEYITKLKYGYAELPGSITYERLMADPTGEGGFKVAGIIEEVFERDGFEIVRMTVSTGTAWSNTPGGGTVYTPLTDTMYIYNLCPDWHPAELIGKNYKVYGSRNGLFPGTNKLSLIGWFYMEPKVQPE